MASAAAITLGTLPGSSTLSQKEAENAWAGMAMSDRAWPVPVRLSAPPTRPPAASSPHSASSRAGSPSGTARPSSVPARIASVVVELTLSTREEPASA